MPTRTELMAKITTNMAQQAALRVQLDASLKIADILPGAFNHGSVKVGARATVHEPHKGIITIRQGDGTVHEFPAMDIPFDLWPSQMQEDFRAMPGHRRKAIEKRLK